MSGLKLEEKKVEFLSFIKKYKILIFSAAAIIFFLIAFNMGISAATVDLEEEKVTYDKLVSRIADKEVELDSKNKSLEDLEKKILTKAEELTSVRKRVDENQDIIEEASAIVNDKENILKDISDIRSQISSKQNELDKLTSDIKAKETELARVTGQIQETEEAPKQLSAGQFLVGKDIPEGRYKVTPIGRGSNFVVYDSSGSLVTNTILSSIPNHGVSEYVTFLSDGEIIDSSTPAKYTPVK
jgi:septal ring factor EnvC (AmiA/AmiB activator)